MSRTQLDLSKIKIAAPCSIPWESMTGDERVRHCDACGLNVNNFAAMTEAEIAAVIGESNGRVCARLFRRADGTILTSDCPRGLAAYRKRVATFAGAALTAVLSLFTVSFGQKTTPSVGGTRPEAARSDSAKLTGVVRDPNGAVVTRVNVTLIDLKGKRLQSVKSDEDGKYGFESVAPGTYDVEFVLPGFKTTRVVKIELATGTSFVLDASLQPAVSYEIVGIVGFGEPDSSAAGGTTTFSLDRDN